MFTVNTDDIPLLQRFEEISTLVGTDSDSEKNANAAKEWFGSRKKMISERLVRAISRSPRGKRKFKIPISEITIGSGKLASDVLELIAGELASTGYECDIKTGHLYFWPMNR